MIPATSVRVRVEVKVIVSLKSLSSENITDSNLILAQTIS
jgi:hypothetical protein